MLNAFRAYGAARITTVGTSTANDPDAQLACAEAASAIDEMKCILHRNYAEIDEAARRGQLPTEEQRLLYRYQSSVVAERCLEIAAKLFKGAGGSGLYATQSFGRIYNDLIAARQHVSNQSQVSGRGFGAVLLGLPNRDPMI
jgi:3-hydroxy-9,10-secoandrosta-1,3,5(10)-triene-9,17-dione monooxygenase